MAKLSTKLILLFTFRLSASNPWLVLSQQPLVVRPKPDFVLFYLDLKISRQ